VRLKLAAGAVCTAVLGANAWTIARETAAPSWDDAWYLETSFRLFDALKDGPLAFAAAYADALKIKAPLVALLPLPLYAAWGPSERLAVWVNQGLLVALWTCVYGFARRLYGERAALCALIVAAVMPLTYGLSRLFLVETLLAALVAWTHYLIASATAEDSTAGRRLGAALGLGLLAKSIFPLYVAAAVWQRRRALAPHAKTALYWGGIIAGTWYAFNLPYVVGFGLSAGFGSIGRDYSSTLGEYATSVGGHALSWPLTAASAALLLALPRAQRRSWHWEPAERLWIGWAGVPAAVLLLGVNKDIRFLGPALPGLAVGLGRAAAQLLDSRGPL
jgi:4-amino-4-deoxy-L-arabinose transferase-like glycosyltransferase